MKKTIYFIRGAPYKYLIKGENLYRSFNKVAQRKFDPGLTNDSRKYFFSNVTREILSSKLIFHSPNKRSRKTALFVNKVVNELKLLSEIDYAMENFVSENEFFVNNEPDVNSARKNFVSALINNNLNESYKHVIERVEYLMSICINSKEETILFISHGFFLKVIEAYIKNPKIKNIPKLLINYFNGENETFKFCEGFKIDYQDNKFTFKSYIRNKCDI